MLILIEQYGYSSDFYKSHKPFFDEVEKLGCLSEKNGKYHLDCVGYFLQANKNSSKDSANTKDSIFILPKVVLKYEEDGEDKELIFGKYHPEKDFDAIILKDSKKSKTEPSPCKLEEKEKALLYELPMWIYRALDVYREQQKNKDENIIKNPLVAKRSGRSNQYSTYFEIITAILRFYNENQDFFFYSIRNLHSGFNRINWPRTIARSQPLIQDNDVIYLNLINKKRQIDTDEELFIIFYSILHYIGQTYGPPFHTELNLDIIRGSRFEKYLHRYGRLRLLEIKRKYFSDKEIELWSLCYDFFSKSEQIYSNKDYKEYLLAKDFEKVFEAMIDDLIGDPLPIDGIKKDLGDGKILDHLFVENSLSIPDTKVYYIGDSKYYKMQYTPEGKDVAKQYTYAKNVIQKNIDIYNSGKDANSTVKLRDEFTEGYDVIPNFFISAEINDALDRIAKIEYTTRKWKDHSKFQFQNRLYDRDTLNLMYFDVNFLHILSLYARNNATAKAIWKKNVRESITQKTKDWLNENYDFYLLTSLNSKAQSFIRHHFDVFNGKLLTFKKDEADKQSVYLLALKKEETAPSTGTSKDIINRIINGLSNDKTISTTISLNFSKDLSKKFSIAPHKA